LQTKTQSCPGIAVKVSANKWHVILDNTNETFMTVTDNDLLDSNQFTVQHIAMSPDNDETTRKKQAAKQKRVRKVEKMQKEKIICEKGLQKRREVELEQYQNLCKRFESGAAPYAFEEFLDLVDLMRKPFVCQIDGHEVSLTQDDCTIMMETSCVKAITESLFAGKEKRKSESNNSQVANKRQNCGNPTVRTECGATGLVALHQTTLRNSRINKQTRKKTKDKLEQESKNISTTLTALAALKQKNRMPIGMSVCDHLNRS